LQEEPEQKKKYDLTDRETQILNLLLQAYTYQEIVKHYKLVEHRKVSCQNIYAKKRCLESEKKMYSTIKNKRLLKSVVFILLVFC